MRKQYLSILCLICSGLAGGMLTESVQAEDPKLKEFFTCVQEGNVEQVLSLMHPQLAKQIDPPILEAWLQAVSFRLGSLETILLEDEIINGSSRDVRAEIVFRKGNAQAQLVYMNGLIVGFEVKSDRLINWLQRPTSLNLYREKGNQFLKHLMAEEYTPCKNLLHEKASERLTEQSLQAYVEKIREVVGPNEKIVYQHAELTILPDERLQQIDLNYEIEGDQGKQQVEIAVRFHVMQGHLVGIRLR